MTSSSNESLQLLEDRIQKKEMEAKKRKRIKELQKGRERGVTNRKEIGQIKSKKGLKH